MGLEPDAGSTAAPGAGWRDCAVAAGLFAVWMAASIGAGRAETLWTAHFWVDEIFTYHIVREPDPARLLAAFQAGAETHLPVYHLLLRATAGWSDAHPEIALRAVSIVSVWLALVGVYTMLRRVFGRWVSFAAAAALWAHPLVLQQAFSARPYAVWLAAAAGFALMLPAALRRPSAARISGLACIAALLCTIHYLGIITFLLIFAGAWVWGEAPLRGRPRVLLALAAGPAVLAGGVAVFYFSQWQAMRGAHWIAEPTLVQVVDFAFAVLLPTSAAGLLLVPAGAALFGGIRAAAGPTRCRGAWAGLAICALMVPALVVFTYLIRPVTVPKYAICATLVLPCAAGLLLTRLTRPWVVLACVFLFVFSAKSLMDLGHARRQRDGATDALIAAIRETPGPEPVLFARSYDLYPVAHYAPDLSDRFRLLGDAGSADPVVSFSARHARIFRHWFNTPAVEDLSGALDRTGFYWVPGPRDPDPPVALRGHRSRSAGPGLMYLSRPGGGGSPAAEEAAED